MLGTSLKKKEEENKEIKHREFEMYEFHQHSLQSQAEGSRKPAGEVKITAELSNTKNKK